MPNPDLEALEAQLHCQVRDERLEAAAELQVVPGVKASKVLCGGLRHWDKELRRACAEALLARDARRGVKEILSAAADGRLTLPVVLELLRPVREASFLTLVAKRAHASPPDSLARLLDTSLDKVEAYRAIAAPFEAKAALQRARLDERRRDKLVAQERANERKRKRQEVVARKAAIARAEECDREGLAEALGLAPDHFNALFGSWIRDREVFGGMYQRHEIPKRRGGVRVLQAPQPALKVAQRAVLDKLLAPLELHRSCHGFRVDHSISTNAAVHVGRPAVVNLDLRDFFPSVTAGRVAGLFAYLELPGGRVGRSFLVDLVTCDGALPQGAPTSPAIANLVCRRLDSRLAGLARKAKAEYTRYADDLTFSGAAEVASLLPRVRAIIEEEGFEIAPEKTRLLRSGTRQDVTGLTVNERVSVPRAIRRRLRAAVHATTRKGAATWKGAELSRLSLLGHLAFLASVHPEEAARLRGQLLAGQG